MKPARRFCPDCQRRFIAHVETCPTDGVPLRIDPFIGSTVGHWRLTDYLGQGAMGVVYCAVPADESRPAPGSPACAAVKILNARRAALQPDLVRRFEIEARAAIRLESPHVARVYDSGTTDDGHLYIAMERLVGGPLDRILARARTLDGPTVATIGYQIAQAMAEAHDKAIVHRDLKPGNVFVEPLPQAVWHVRVLDFGVARMRIGGMDRTRTGIVAGTPSYMSPEQLRGFRDLDGRSDIYSLGVLLYRMLAGRNPFQGDGSFIQAHQLHLQQPPPPLPETVPAALDTLIMRMLEKTRESRPQTMYEVQAQLLTTGLIDLRAGSTVFELDARTVAGVVVPREPSDATAPDSDGVLATAVDSDRTRLDDAVRTGDERTEIVPGDSEIVCMMPSKVAARAAAAEDGLASQPTVRRAALTETLDLPPVRRGRDLRAMAMILLVAGAAIGTGLGIGLQYGLTQPMANAAHRAGDAPVEAEAEPAAAQAAATAEPSAGDDAPEEPTPHAATETADAPVAMERSDDAPAEAEETGAEAAAADDAPAPARPEAAVAVDPPDIPLTERPARAAPRASTTTASARTSVRKAESAPRLRDPGTFDGRLDAALTAADNSLEGRAAELLRAAARQRPESPIPHQRLCTLYARIGLHAKALDSCLMWRTREPKAAYRASIDRRIAALEARLGR